MSSPLAVMSAAAAAGHHIEAECMVRMVLLTCHKPIMLLKFETHTHVGICTWHLYRTLPFC
jgi:hypothetical protein